MSDDLEFEDEFKRALGLKSADDDLVDRLWPNLPDWVKTEYSAKEWLWLPQPEKDRIMNFGRKGFDGFDDHRED